LNSAIKHRGERSRRSAIIWSQAALADHFTCPSSVDSAVTRMNSSYIVNMQSATPGLLGIISSSLEFLG
jgi:hypothetical protein